MSNTDVRHNQRVGVVWPHAVGAGLALLVIASAVAVRSSSAAFTATTANTGNSWEAGSVTLGDDDSDTAMFSVTGMMPGDPEVRCIEVSYSGSLDADVKLYGAITGGTGLEDYIDITVERGTGGSFGDCSGFSASESVYTGTLAGLATDHTSFADGAGTWAPVGGGPTDAVVYRFTTALQDDVQAQGLATTATFTWEAQSA